MARTIATSVASTVIAAGAIGLWTVGGFVTGNAYAEGQGKLDQIIQLLTYSQERKALVEKIKSLDGDISDAKAYYDATPEDAEIRYARKARYDRLVRERTGAQEDLAQLDKMEEAKR